MNVDNLPQHPPQDAPDVAAREWSEDDISPCLCGSTYPRKHLTTNMGEWIVCEKCSRGTFRPYRAGLAAQSSPAQWNALAIAVREAAAKLAELARERDRLTGKMCLICGRLEPCEEAPDACTFDPHPIDAARAFLNRAHKAEAERDKLRELLRRSRSWVDALMDAKLCAAIDAALAEGKK
jgi:hypothetical protein